MAIIFEIIDKTGRRIHLSKERWSYITTKHPYMASKLEDIKGALIKPTLIVPHKFDENMRNYYLLYKEIKRYLHVVVRYLNDEGFVASAFITRKIIRR
ncbi:hypothetical protein B6U80_01715 [Candidatus Pacearchaeota archaeon ex4484_26]|nr:MAG: hypothetical protein B6U80_01715 [Candidatus Pacearchaeota archaeon ex4484_26]